MLNRFFFTLIIIVGVQFPKYVQAQTDSLINKLDSLQNKKDSLGEQANNTNPSSYNELTKITPKTYFILLGSNLKQGATKPFHMTKKDWVNLGKFGVITGGLAFTDLPVQKFVTRLTDRNPGLEKSSTYVTNFGGVYELYVLGGIGVYGYLFKNEKMKTTTYLATQAYLTSTVFHSALKFITGRQRPYLTDSTRVQNLPTFYGPFYKSPKDASGKKIFSSFPSGHTALAFAAATVYAMEYKDKLWVPLLAYSSASLIGLSRITENKHWVTDVFVGAALGYLTGKQVVNNYHRYAKIKSGKRTTGKLSFNLQYMQGQILPGFTYTFR